jgi:hypothetical protein
MLLSRRGQGQRAARPWVRRQDADEITLFDGTGSGAMGCTVESADLYEVTVIEL